MTSPSVDLDGIMPYGVNVSAPTNTTYITPDGNSSRVNGSFVLLPVGPCQVQFTWPGKQDAYVRWMDSANNEKGVPIEISGGGISPRPLSSAQPPATNCRSVLEPTPRRVRQEPSRCIPRPDNHGGGLNDHATRNAGRGSALCDSLQDGQRGLHGARARATRHGRVLHPTRRCVPSAVGVYGAGSRRSVVEARRGQRVNNQDVSDSRRPVGHSTVLPPAYDSNTRRWPIVDYDDTSPERRRTVHLNRIPAHLPTTSVAAGVVA